MATYYVRSTDGDNGSDGSTWADAKATLAGALAVCAAGDTVYVSHVHAEETAGNVTLTSPGVSTNPVHIICVNDGAEPPTALATTATVQANGYLYLNGSVYAYGITFISNVVGAALIQITTAAASWQKLENCILKFAGSHASNYFDLYSGTANANYIELVGTSLHFGNVANYVRCSTNIVWKDSTALTNTSAIPTTLFTSANTLRNPSVRVSGVDLSGMTGGSLVNAALNQSAAFEFRNCRIHANTTPTTGTAIGLPGTTVRMVNCDDGDTNYTYSKTTPTGTETEETTIVRVSGASDGTTSLGRKMVSSNLAAFVSPMISDPVVIWSNTSGSEKTATVEIVNDGATLTDAEVWLEVEYLGTSGSSQSSFARDSKAGILATAADQATSDASWTTTGLTSPVKQKLEVAFTPQEKGPVFARVHLAKANTTLYYDPLVTLS